LPEVKTFALNVRIPAWSEGAVLRVNGRRDSSPAPGTFATVRREWRSGDRIELELPLSRDLESIDAQHPNLVALRSGPLVLMRVLDDTAPSPIPRQSLLAARRDPAGAHAWQVPTAGGPVTLKAFADIGSERYRAYQAVLPS
jgi:DUF1680 family protein